jgi:uncharacterized protein
MRLILAWLLTILALAGSPAHAALPPQPTGPVLDQAGIIAPTDEAALDAKLRAYNKDTGRAIIVATVTSLDGMAVERYAQELARAWDIGGKESQEGVLFLVAPNERKIRIHTAVGAQGRLTDGFLGRTIREVITPRFKAKDMAGGINAGVDAVIAHMNRDETDAVAIAEAAAAADAQRGSDERIGAGSVIFWIVLILFFLMLFGRRRRGYRRSGFGRGVGVWYVGEVAANVAINVALNAALGGDGDGGDGGGGFGGFGGGGGGFDGGGASGDW